MKKKRFSTEQIVAVLKQAEMGMAVADLIRQIGISEQTFYRWKKRTHPVSTAAKRLFSGKLRISSSTAAARGDCAAALMRCA